MNIIQPNFRFNNPIGEKKLEEVINLLDIKSSDTIVDVGGGNGEVLRKMLQKSNAYGILIDLDKKLIEACREQSKLLIASKKLLLIAEDAKVYLNKLAHNSIDCFVCIGSSHAFGDYMTFIKAITPYLKPGGFLIVGEGFWQQKPSQEYLEILGGTESEMMYHHENIEAPEKLGLTYLYSHTASEDEWNQFEGLYFLKEELKALDLPDDQRHKYLTNLRAFRTGQFKLGRSTMGFGLYLFCKGKPEISVK